ncbi:MAG: competence/damage-inducible protein A [Oscillospiraceae bacterium]|nr:competence/damage-inducible protein A [Oscillospiraceae bacterium]
MFTCELCSVGTELLLGDILNTNAQYLSRELAALGIAVLHQGTVGDNPQRLADELSASLKRSDIVILTGGLGPTADDITKEVCCELLGFQLVRDESILRSIAAHFQKRGSVMPASNLKQADVPASGTVFENTRGTAPGMALEKDGKCVILLPGPPKEMSAMFDISVRPFLLNKYADGVIVSRSIRTFGIGESAMAERIADMLDGENPTVAPYAKEGEALVRVTAKAESAEAAHALLAPVVSEITARLGEFVYGIDAGSLQETVVKLLLEKKLKAAFAESCTAGYVAKRLTEIPGASEVFDCGVVTYSNAMKVKLLGVSEQTLREHGAVSEQTAREMAEGVRAVSGADVGVSVTGVAGPGASEKKPAGLSYIGICGKEGTFAVRFETGREHDREYNRYVTSSKALDVLRRYINSL